LLGRTEQSRPNAAQRRANDAGLDGEGAIELLARNDRVEVRIDQPEAAAIL